MKKTKKTTYVTRKGLEKAKEEAARLTEEAVEELRSIGKECGFMEGTAPKTCIQRKIELGGSIMIIEMIQKENDIKNLIIHS